MRSVERVKVISNEQVRPGHFKMRLELPERWGEIRPGQFVHIKIGGSTDPLLRRPFSFYDVGEGWFEVLYKVVGRGTELLSKAEEGDELDVLGPLGNGFRIGGSIALALLVGGGVGVASLFLLARKLRERGISVLALIGASTSERLLCVDELRSLGAEVRVATEDGSAGFKGTVVELMEEAIGGLKGVKAQIYACGPIGMLEGVCRARKGLPAQLSFESRMACGLGICLGCVIPTVSGRRYLRVCVDGPVFEADWIDWEGLRRGFFEGL